MHGLRSSRRDRRFSPRRLPQWIYRWSAHRNLAQRSLIGIEYQNRIYAFSQDLHFLSVDQNRRNVFTKALLRWQYHVIDLLDHPVEIRRDDLCNIRLVVLSPQSHLQLSDSSWHTGYLLSGYDETAWFPLKDDRLAEVLPILLKAFIKHSHEFMLDLLVLSVGYLSKVLVEVLHGQCDVLFVVHKQGLVLLKLLKTLALRFMILGRR